MLLSWFLIILGIGMLYVGAEFLIRAAVELASHFKIPRLVLALTVIAFTTAVPEALASVMGQIQGNTGDIALGNVLGSNTANIGLVLGVFLLIRPCHVPPDMNRQKMPLLFFTYLLIFLVMWGGTIHRLEGAFLFVVMILYILLQYFLLPPKKREVEEEIAIYTPQKQSHQLLLHIGGMIAGPLLLIFGAKFLVDGALTITRLFQLSERIIGISIVAVGTCLPELATAIVAACRKEHDIILGTVIGSNIFNPLFVIPCATLVKPITFSEKILQLDFPLMLLFSSLLWLFILLGRGRLSRIHGGLLLVGYFSYLIFLFF